ncbi:MAG: hypothetical protein QW774_01980 [Candidatus Micrarchaeaceae archaeon]
MDMIKEGEAKIRLLDGVFYNQKATGLRNMSVLFLNAAKELGMVNEESKLLDCTAATGIRGIRYALECGLRNVCFIDINKKAALLTRTNVRLNRIKADVKNASIQKFTNSTSVGAYDIIDLDPFGTVAPYVFDLMKISKDGTILMATATDTAVLCGAHRSACIKLYSAIPLHGDICHETGTRILIGYIARIAAQFNFGIEVMLSIAEFHYIRVFIRLRRGAAAAYESASKNGFCTYCKRCSNFSCSFAPNSLGKKCAYCGAEMEFFGPLWLGNLYNKDIVRRMLRSASGTEMKTLKIIENELDTPLFYYMPKITKFLGISSVPLLELVEKLGGSSRTQFSRDGIKTDKSIGYLIKIAKNIAKSKGL